MVFKLLILCLLTVYAWQLQLTHNEVKWISKKLKRWTGPLTECNQQCTKAGGVVCDEFPKICCQKGACSKNNGILVCSKSVEGFQCQKSNENGLSYLYPLLPQLKKVAQ